MYAVVHAATDAKPHQPLFTNHTHNTATNKQAPSPQSIRPHSHTNTHLKVLLGMSPSTLSRSRSTGVGVPGGASLSRSTTRPLPSMVPMTCPEGGEREEGEVIFSGV